MRISKRIRELLIGVLLVLLCVSIGYAAIPETINYQGYLTNSDGVPIDGPVAMVFSLYDVSTGGTALWSESQNVSVTNGIYSVILGTGTPIFGSLGTLAFDKQYYLGIRVGSDPADMTPRQPLTSVAYAFTADTARNVADNVITSAMIQDGSISSADVNFNYAGSTFKGGAAADVACAGCVSLTDVDTTAIQRRVTGTCASGNSIREIKQDGTVTCEADDVGSGVPSGFMILGETASPPAGYTYTGKTIDVSWATRASMPTARSNLVAAVVSNKIYLIGGYNGSISLATNEEYDPVTDSWATKANMPTARYTHSAAVLNNKIYVIGGTNVSPWPGSPLATNEEYDPATNSWATKANMPTARTVAAAAAVNSKIYVIGGASGSGTPININQEYDPASNTWATKTSMITARYAPGAAVVNNKVYVIGGFSSTFVATNEEYDPATNTWATKASMFTSRSDPGAAVLNNRVYVIGGWINLPSTSTLFSTNEEYDPVTNTWTVRASMPTARFALAAATVNNKIYAIGGTNSLRLFFSTNEEYYPGQLYIHKKN